MAAQANGAPARGQRGARPGPASARLRRGSEPEFAGTDAFEQLHPGQLHEREQQRAPASHAADMAPPGDVALGRRAEIDELDGDEHADDPVGADAQRDAEHQRGQLGAGPQHQIGDHDAGDRTGCADQRHLRTRIAEHEGERAERADQQIEREEAPAAERLLDIVGEHPDEDQVADQMHDVGMQELVGEQRQPRVERAGKAVRRRTPPPGSRRTGWRSPADRRWR